MTDSLSLPRKHPDGEVRWEDIYVSLLRKELPEIEFIHVGLGGATIVDLYSQLNYYSFIQADLILLHCGIVDCTPRAFGRIELEIIKKLRLFRVFKPFVRLMRKYRGITYTPYRQFKKTLINLKKRFEDIPIWAIGILPGCEEYEQIVPRVSQNILKYNEILKSETYFIDNSTFPREGILSDYHHLNKTGQLILFQKLKSELKQWAGREFKPHDQAVLSRKK